METRVISAAFAATDRRKKYICEKLNRDIAMQFPERLQTAPLVNLAIAFFLICIVAVTGCDKNETEEEDPGFTGWLVGDSANSWGTILQTGNDGFDWYRQGSISDLTGVNLKDVSAASAMNVWVAGDTLGGFGMIYNTTDGGYTWQRKGDTNQLGFAGFRAIHAKNGNRVWAAGEAGTLVYTDNGGISWTKVLLPGLEEARFEAITSHKGQRLWVIGNLADTAGSDTAAVVLVSTDGGNSWSRQFQGQGFPGTMHDVVAVNDTIVYFSAGISIYQTIDGGGNWQPVYTSTYGKIRCITADTNGNVWAGGELCRVYHSRHGGSNWTVSQPDLTKYTLTGVTMADTNRVWLVGYASGSANRGIVLYTRNTGNTWYPAKPVENTPLNKISFVNGVK
jgi:photosystem II stability/assembly factor-like uncharacterized protein